MPEAILCASILPADEDLTAFVNTAMKTSDSYNPRDVPECPTGNPLSALLRAVTALLLLNNGAPTSKREAKRMAWGEWQPGSALYASIWRVAAAQLKPEGIIVEDGTICWPTLRAKCARERRTGLIPIAETIGSVLSDINSQQNNSPRTKRSDTSS